jgi:aspartate racemase
MISIIYETRRKAVEYGYKKIGLLGTKLTMTKDLYDSYFLKKNIRIIKPNRTEVDLIHKKIMTELIYGKFTKKTKKLLLGIIQRMEKDDEIDSVLLGCTELPLIISKNDIDVPILDTTHIHIDSIIHYLKKND